MTAYYNEHDPFAAAWLRNLIAEGHIAPGDVDERSIEDVLPTELAGYTQCHFFAGIGVWSYALRQAGWPDDRPVWTGSCPCQPFSEAGAGGGFADERHLWPALFHLIKERKPPKFFGEQVARNIDWLALVRSDLEAVGYAVGALPMEAASFDADHRRDRFWIVANATSSEARPTQSSNSESQPRAAWTNASPQAGGRIGLCGRTYRRPESGICLLADGTAANVALLRPFGNAIDARPAQGFIESVMEITTPAA